MNHDLVSDDLARKLRRTGLLPASQTYSFSILWFALPRTIEKSNTYYWLSMDKTSDGTMECTRLCYEGLHENVLLEETTAQQSMADACARLILTILKNGYAKVYRQTKLFAREA